MKKILLFGAGRSATILIDYLITEAGVNNWTITVADVNRDLILSKTGRSPYVEAVEIDILDSSHRSELIRQGDIVISMMPPALHILIARDCILYGKDLLTASYVDAAIKELEFEIKQKNLLFLCEMGLDPGIDHMSAMRLIEQVQSAGGKIRSFKSHCGGLIAPESDDNPWHYKISWNPRNIVMAGKAGAEYKMNNEIKHIAYADLFKNCNEVIVEGLNTLANYPNRDSLSYIPLYGLQDAETFVRTTLRVPSFCNGWQAIVQAGLTDEHTILTIENLTFKEWSAAIEPFVTDENNTMLAYLGLFDDNVVPTNATTSADILQYLLETKLAMQPQDKDMIVMLHEIEYTSGDTHKKVASSLVIKGTDSLRTAMATTVGLPLGIAAKLILNGSIRLTGIHIPVTPEIYHPVLSELEKAGVCFTETKETLAG